MCPTSNVHQIAPLPPPLCMLIYLLVASFTVASRQSLSILQLVLPLLLPGACLLACLPSCLPAAWASGLIWLDLLSALASALICVLTTDFAPEWRPRALCGGLAAPRSGFSLSPPLSGRSVLLCPCSVPGLSCVFGPVSVVVVLSAHSVIVLLSVAVVRPSPCHELSCRMS